MRIAVTGSSGFLGRSLIQSLTHKKVEAIPMVRNPNFPGVYWNYKTGELDISSLESIDAFIHLAGESVFGFRWTSVKKKKIWESRVESTRFLIEKMNSLNTPPKVFICSSGLGYYGNNDKVSIDESTPKGTGFLSDVCQGWEAPLNSFLNEKTRMVSLRTGLVLSKSSGALQKLITPAKWGVGAVMGKGQQGMSWISLQDWVRAVEYIIVNDVSGPVNMAGENPVSNRDFTKNLSQVLRRPQFLSLPAFLIKIMMGQMGEEMVLYGQYAHPKKLLEAGFEFKDKELKPFLEGLFN